MRTITKSRFLWTSKASELSLKSGSPVLEGPAESYPTEELQRKVIRRLQIQERWRNPDPLTFCSRQLNVDLQTHGRLHLLPGGRWLLDNIAGYVYALDLEKTDPMPQELFKEKHCTYTGRLLDPLSGYAIWIDSSKPWLSLRIALHNDRSSSTLSASQFHPFLSPPDACPKQESSRICIYQLNFNACDTDAAWSVKPMVTLMCPGPCFKKGIQIGEDYVVERCRYKNGNVEIWKVHVFRYSDPSPRVVVWEYPTAATVSIVTTSHTSVSYDIY